MIGRTLAPKGSAFMLLFLLWSNSLVAGDAAGNGGGLGDKEFLIDYVELPLTISDCLNSSSCVQDAKGRALLESIQKTLTKQREDAKARKLNFEDWIRERIEFVKNEQLAVPGRPCSAMTGNEWNSPIRVMIEHLYEKAENGLKVPISMGSRVALQLDELAHQSGFDEKKSDHAELDRLGAQVKEFLSGQTSSLRLYGSAVNVTARNFNSDLMKGDLFVRDHFTIRNLNEELAKAIECPKESSSEMKVGGLRVSNLHEGRVTAAKGKDKARLFGRVEAVCVRASTPEYQGTTVVNMGMGDVFAPSSRRRNAMRVYRDFVVDIEHLIVPKEGTLSRELKLEVPEGVNPGHRVLPEKVRVFDCGQETKDPLCH